VLKRPAPTTRAMQSAAGIHKAPFAAGLAACIQRCIAGAQKIANLTRLSGGASQETWSFRAVGPGVNRPLILRRQPDTIGMAPKLPLATEAALMRAAGAAGVPSPHVLHVLEAADRIGTGFIMDHIAGETIARKLLRNDEFAAARRKLPLQVGAILARIHALQPGNLPPLPITSARKELGELREAYHRDGQPRPVFELAFRWLAERAPPDPATPSVVHGDFRTGNLIVGSDGIRAVLDWELACRGDPVRDLGWFCTISWRFGAIDSPAGGFGSREELLEGYQAAGGRPVSLQELYYWEVFGSLRWGVICLGMRARSAGNDRPLERAMIGRRASEAEIDLLHLIAPLGV
jgi:aminoglycoside phosphotransferase (APT) family kinase protein